MLKRFIVFKSDRLGLMRTNLALGFECRQFFIYSIKSILIFNVIDLFSF